MTPGPPPKPAHARRRRNAPALGEWIDLAPLEKPVTRPLPTDREWSTRARATWEAWCRDPVNVLWGPADVAYALDTLRLVDAAARQFNVSLAAEIRLRVDGLGLSPKGRRNLRWRIVDPVQVIKHPSTPNSPSAQRRRRLLAVDHRERTK